MKYYEVKNNILVKIDLFQLSFLFYDQPIDVSSAQEQLQFLSIHSLQVAKA